MQVRPTDAAASIKSAVLTIVTNAITSHHTIHFFTTSNGAGYESTEPASQILYSEIAAAAESGE